MNNENLNKAYENYALLFKNINMETPKKEDLINDLVNDNELLSYLLNDEYQKGLSRMYYNSISDDEKNILFKYLFKYVNGDLEHTKALISKMIPFLDIFFNNKEKLTDPIETNMCELLEMLMQSDNPEFVQRLTEKIFERYSISKIYNIIGNANRKVNLEAISKSNLTSSKIDTLRKGINISKNRMIEFIKKTDNFNELRELLSTIIPNFKVFEQIDYNEYIDVEYDDDEFSDYEHRERIIKRIIANLSFSLSNINIDDSKRITCLKNAFRHIIQEEIDINEIIKELCKKLNIHEEIPNQDNVQFYNLDGQDFTFLIHCINYQDSQGITDKRRVKNMEYGIEMIHSPELWIQDGPHYNNCISTSTISQNNIITYGDGFFRPDSIIIGFGEVPFEQVHSVKHDDAGTGPAGDLPTVYQELYHNEKINTGYSDKYNEIVIDRYLPNGEKRRPSFIILNQNYSKSQLEDSIKWAKFYNIPIIIINPEAYVERFSKEFRQALNSDLPIKEKIEKALKSLQIESNWANKAPKEEDVIELVNLISNADIQNEEALDYLEEINLINVISNDNKIQEMIQHQIGKISAKQILNGTISDKIKNLSSTSIAAGIVDVLSNQSDISLEAQEIIASNLDLKKSIIYAIVSRKIPQNSSFIKSKFFASILTEDILLSDLVLYYDTLKSAGINYEYINPQILEKLISISSDTPQFIEEISTILKHINENDNTTSIDTPNRTL